ncbi:MAG: multicopper oxidase family protein [Actinomycetota bacterium]|nr:multicopper oxidase family protein [Actinomycetota bacterium]
MTEQTQAYGQTTQTTIDVPPGGSFDLHVGPVEKRIGDVDLPMLAYNGSIPGPRLRVKQGSQIFVHVVNDTVMETTVHWHGLRLENAHDGVPHETQAPIAPGGRYTHRLTFPDPGLYWYHPHMREHYAQELGLYGNVIVEPADASYWPPADREVVLTLDDILIEDGAIAPFDPHRANYTAMGRFGNVLLIGGATSQHFAVHRGEVVRLYLTNTANTRVFNVAAPGARMKLVGGDSGRYEHEAWIDHVIIAPSERAIVDVCFDNTGAFQLQHVTPDRTYVLADVDVTDDGGRSSAGADFKRLRTNDDMVAERQRAERYLVAAPDKTLALVADMDVVEPDGSEDVVYVCPMHADVVRDEPGKCPLCGMKLLPASRRDATSPAASGHGHHDHAEAMADGIEWEDLMPEVNRATTTANMHWKLVDRDTGAENRDISWTFRAGDQVKVRLVNEMASDHPMHHPFHMHGERFLVLSRDGQPEPNLVWKDTVLLRTGQTVDIVLDASNPGLWMAHCHIPEHMESGMMFSFRVNRADT